MRVLPFGLQPKRLQVRATCDSTNAQTEICDYVAATNSQFHRWPISAIRVQIIAISATRSLFLSLSHFSSLAISNPNTYAHIHRITPGATFIHCYRTPATVDNALCAPISRFYPFHIG